MKIYFIIAVLLLQVVVCRSQNSLRAHPGTVEFECGQVRGTICFFADSTYKTVIEWADTIPAPKDFRPYLDSGRYTLTKDKIKLHSKKRIPGKEDRYLRNDEINLLWKKDNNGWEYQTMIYFWTTKNIKYGKSQKIWNDMYWPVER